MGTQKNCHILFGKACFAEAEKARSCSKPNLSHGISMGDFGPVSISVEPTSKMWGKLEGGMIYNICHLEFLKKVDYKSNRLINEGDMP